MTELPVPLLTVPEAAEFLGMSVSFLNKGRLTGSTPPFFKFGSAVRYSQADLIEWMASRRRTSTSDQGVRAA
jgi:predicted DNA-binding transcriptional regulator AlpA